MNGIWGLDGSNSQSQCPDIDDFIFVMQKDVLICKTYILQYSGVRAYHVGNLLLNSSGKKRVVCTSIFPISLRSSANFKKLNQKAQEQQSTGHQDATVNYQVCGNVKIWEYTADKTLSKQALLFISVGSINW